VTSSPSPSPTSIDAKTVALTLAALCGFAANSLLCRAALGTHEIGAAYFTLVRLASGAIVLTLLVRASPSQRAPSRQGSWRAAAALFAYAIAFSYAYLRLVASVGALVLFGVVQITMILGGLRAGERPRAAQWLGLAIAFGGLVALNLPGLTAPDPLGAVLMATAGVAWGLYSLLGRDCKYPLAATAENFAFSVPMIAVIASLTITESMHTSPRGLLLAVVSGALTSGVGYSFWYAALRKLSATRAAIVQLSVPVLTALGSVALLSESISARLAVAGSAILAGVALAVLRR
jgi:drug/metabolite transporter (DMT)-like permease